MFYALVALFMVAVVIVAAGFLHGAHRERKRTRRTDALRAIRWQRIFCRCNGCDPDRRLRFTGNPRADMYSRLIARNRPQVIRKSGNRW